MKHKKGFFELTGALIVLFTIIFLFGMFGLFLYQPLQEINTDMQADPNLSNTSKSVIGDTADRFDTWNDGALAIIMVFLTLVMAAIAYFSAQHPLYLVVVGLLLVAMLIVLPVLSNVWDETAGSDSYSTYRNDFPITNFILNNYLLVIILDVLIIVFAMYSGRST